MNNPITSSTWLTTVFAVPAAGRDGVTFIPQHTNVPLTDYDPVTGAETTQRVLDANRIPFTAKALTIAARRPNHTAQSQHRFWHMIFQQRIEQVVDLVQPAIASTSFHLPVGHQLTYAAAVITCLAITGDHSRLQIHDLQTGRSHQVRLYRHLGLEQLLVTEGMGTQITRLCRLLNDPQFQRVVIMCRMVSIAQAWSWRRPYWRTKLASGGSTMRIGMNH